MIWSRKRGARRKEIRKNRPDAAKGLLSDLKSDHGVFISLWVAALFFAGASAMMMLRENVVQYRPGQYASHDVVSRVKFSFNDKDRLAEKQRIAREMEPRVYKPADDEPWKRLEEQLLNLPARVAGHKEEELPANLRDVLDSGALTQLQEYAAAKSAGYSDAVRSYLADVRKLDPIILDEAQR